MSLQSDIIISIVIPAKNETSNISRCLDSLINNTSYLKDNVEIILVDCYSVDKTIEISAKYPIKILQLKPNWPHCASAARYIGGIFASGEYVFFMDADMTLETGFLEKATDILEKDRNIAAVGGIGKEKYINNEIIVGSNNNLLKTSNTMAKVNFLGGAALYRRSALLEAGGFNPYLTAGEENELAQRLRKKGYYLISMPFTMIIHYTAQINQWAEFLRKRKMNLFVGIGQSLRLSHSIKYLLETLLYYRAFTLFLLNIIYEIVILIYLSITYQLQLIYLVFLPTVILLIGLIFKKRNIKSALLSFIKWHILSLDIIQGLLMRPKNPNSYPKDPDIIKGTFHV